MGLVRPVGRKRRRIDGELRREVIRLAAKGATYREILEVVDTSMGAITIVLKQWGGVTRSDTRWEPSPHRLSMDDRVEIKLGVERGESYRLIGDRIGRDKSTVCREVNNNDGPTGYKPAEAHQRAWERARRPKPTKLEENPRLCRRVIADLTKLWSPQQIAERLKDEFGDDETMQVSHETIYKSIYVQGRGALRKELAACLRTGRAQRRLRGRPQRQGRIPEMIMISERPAEVEDRAVPGHWEGDLIIGKNNKSAIGTLVERATRYVMLLHLPDGFGAEAVRDAMTGTIKTLPDHLWKSITWDQGREMTQHSQFSVDTGIDIYFCDPHSPWQRGSNENTNGLLRQWFPKGTDLSVHGPDKLLEVAQLLNDRPRKTLGWKKPAEVLAQLITGDDVAPTG
jgi:IS30 family transposase